MVTEQLIESQADIHWQSLVVVGGHWRSTQINFKPVYFIQSYMSDGLDWVGLDGMVITGRRQSKSTFGANEKKSCCWTRNQLLHIQFDVHLSRSSSLWLEWSSLINGAFSTTTIFTKNADACQDDASEGVELVGDLAPLNKIPQLLFFQEHVGWTLTRHLAPLSEDLLKMIRYRPILTQTYIQQYKYQCL